ncbi:molybdenum cofactor guanylyltransferase [Demequina aestuarii]|uniref:molybdenum cofactor guanylyltransferase n=1 Tax=Demequina aestuarii TaxID=327095 RepID=UPI0007847C99|nr:NTP transferase domain-containing protein [Demequina aestuarii]
MTTTGAIILTGGGARRLGGVDKASVRVGEATLLEHALAAAARCAPVVIVGPVAPGHPDVVFTREDPPGGGPVAAIAAGFGVMTDDSSRVLVLACDMPHAHEAVPALLEALEGPGADGVDGAWATDRDSRAQPLLAVYRRESLTRALAALGDPHGASMRALASPLVMRTVPVGGAARDADTWDDVMALREEWR